MSSQVTVSTNPRRRTLGSFADTRRQRRRINYGKRMSLYRSVRTRTPHSHHYPFERNVSIAVRYNPSTGFNSIGYGIAFAFQLQNIVTEFGNATTVNTAIAGSTEFTTLFDQYRIDKVEMQCFYSATVTDGVAGSNIPMPCMYIVNDYTDTNVAAGTTNLAEYSQARVVQFSQSAPMIRHTLYKPSAKIDMRITGGTQPAGEARSPWLSTSFPDVNHFAIKCQAIGIPFFDPNSVTGSMLFQFKIFYTCKNAK